MKRLLVIGIMYTMFFLIGNIHLHADERTNVKEITSLEEPTWIFQAGISKGNIMIDKIWDLFCREIHH